MLIERELSSLEATGKLFAKAVLLDGFLDFLGSWNGDGESAGAHQGIDGGVTAAERPISFGGIDGVARGKDMLAQSVGDCAIVEAIGFEEGFGGIGCECVSPEITVITGRIPIAGENVGEMRQSMTHDNLGRHADPREFLLFERGRINRAITGEVQFHVQQPAGEKFGGCKTLVERPRAVDPFHQRFGQRSPGFMMQGKAAEELGSGQPSFEKLRWQFNVIARDTGSGQGRVGDIGKKAVECMTEFMKECLGVAP